MEKNFDLMLDAITRRRIPEIVPMYEHGIDIPIVDAIMGYNLSKVNLSTRDGMLEFWKKYIEFHRQMGYVHVSVEMPVNFAGTLTITPDYEGLEDPSKRGWVDEHDGLIKTRTDLDNKDYWPTIDNAFDYDLFSQVTDMVPEGMKIIGGASGGPFEHASFLMGLEGFCIAAYEDPEMIDQFMTQIGTTLIGIAERLSKLDKVGIYRFGDDLGYKSATMISPDMLKKYVFPWSKKVVEAVHNTGKPFLLHSCGQLEKVMDDLIDDVKIDAKHSFEDVIMPVTQAKERWGDRIALLGGLDVDYLCRHTPEQIREYTLGILDVCSQNGGYAAGSGNSIASYMPVENYLAMVHAIEEYNRK